MVKSKTIFFCNSCGFESPKWLGKCPGCGSWNTMVEELSTKIKVNGIKSDHIKTKPLYMKDIEVTDEERTTTGLLELDRVLGGGIVKGSLILVGGDPGIGKSTLLLQVSRNLSQSDKVVLYVSGEESPKQIKIRADRLAAGAEKLIVLPETDLSIIEEYINEIKPQFIIIDSIQTMYRQELQSTPGSVSQVREATSALMRIAKQLNIATFIVGHVTKEGAIAGPRILEHMVDTVLYFEGERHQTYRIIRAVKNRFGSTNEIGIFEMKNKGLEEVINPSQMLLSGRPHNVSGSCVVCTLEGTRPVLIEIQALTSTTSFGMPRRMATGFDYNRVILLMAVLEKRVGMQIQSSDAYVNIAGGLKVDEPACDLGIVCAIASSFRNMPIDYTTVLIGEIGLTGEVRGVNGIEKRIIEAEKLGFLKCVIPKDNLKGLEGNFKIKIVAVDNIHDALSKILGV